MNQGYIFIYLKTDLGFIRCLVAMHTIKLIQLYYQVCTLYKRYSCENVLRFNSNGQEGVISDEELLTIYLFCTIEEDKLSKKGMHKYILNHWHSWFPTLPSYATFNDRLNRLSVVFPLFLNMVLEDLSLPSNPSILLADSFPIITCSGKRVPQVAKHLVSKDYCASKDLWYHGLRLHTLAHQAVNRSLPVPAFLKVETASTHDLEVVRPILAKLQNVTVVADKAYSDLPLSKQLEEENKVFLFIPEKKKKNESQKETQDRYAYRKALNRAVAKIRQPIESLFAWLDRKTHLQNATKVRSEKGLMLHIFGKITAAFMSLLTIINP